MPPTSDVNRNIQPYNRTDNLQIIVITAPMWPTKSQACGKLCLDRKDMGKTTESDCYPNPTTNSNPNPYLVVVQHGSPAVGKTTEYMSNILCA